jgi:hypothetical protein
VQEVDGRCSKLKEEKTKLEGMVKSQGELIMEIAKETGLDCMGEVFEDEDEDDNAGGDAATLPAAAPPSHAPLAAATPEEIIVEEGPMEMIPEQEALVPHEVILADVEPKLSQPQLYLDDSDESDDPSEAEYDVDEWILEEGSNDQD